MDRVLKIWILFILSFSASAVCHFVLRTSSSWVMASESRGGAGGGAGGAGVGTGTGTETGTETETGTGTAVATPVQETGEVDVDVGGRSVDVEKGAEQEEQRYRQQQQQQQQQQQLPPQHEEYQQILLKRQAFLEKQQHFTKQQTDPSSPKNQQRRQHQQQQQQQQQQQLQQSQQQQPPRASSYIAFEAFGFILYLVLPVYIVLPSLFYCLMSTFKSKNANHAAAGQQLHHLNHTWTMIRNASDTPEAWQNTTGTIQPQQSSASGSGTATNGIADRARRSYTAYHNTPFVPVDDQEIYEMETTTNTQQNHGYPLLLPSWMLAGLGIVLDTTNSNNASTTWPQKNKNSTSSKSKLMSVVDLHSSVVSFCDWKFDAENDQNQNLAFDTSSSSCCSTFAPASVSSPSCSGTKITYKWKEQHSCIVCLDDFTMNTQVRVLPCGHIFHPSCVEGWLIIARRNSCPFCTQIVIPYFDSYMNCVSQPMEMPFS